jgi:hypothetical protein
VRQHYTLPTSYVPGRTTSNRLSGSTRGRLARFLIRRPPQVRSGSFSWEGNDENDLASDRGWVVLGIASRPVGHFYIHNSDDSGFACDRA